jgi:TRAP-type C4-dicarboxylate transport system permease small subunit
MQRLVAWLRRGADAVAVALLTAKFATFIDQIFTRYVLDAPLGWTLEVCLTTWLWVVFWDTAFGLADRDHVKFDVLYLAGNNRVRRVLALLAAAAIAGGLIYSAPATYSFITFYKIKTSATLHLRLDYVFSIYGVFAVATILRYLWRIIFILRGGSPDTVEPGHESLIEGEGTGRP